MTLDRRRFFQLAAGVGVAGTVGLPRLALAGPGGSRPAGEWIAGDFHCHSTYSHDVWSGPSDDNTGPEELYTYGHMPGEQIALAELRGLDFLAITDHNRVASLYAPDYVSSRLTLLPGYEHSLPDSDHCGVFMPSRDALPGIIPADGGTASFLDEVHARGGMAVVNHPFYGNETDGESLAWDKDLADSLRFDAVEVWNSMWLTRYDTVPPYDADNHLAVKWWDSSFAAARRGTALGGSDNHWKLLDGSAGVGQPTTWVGRAAMLGGTVHGDGQLLAVVTASGAAGQRLRLVSGGEVVHETRVLLPSQRIEVPVVLPPGHLRRDRLRRARHAARRAGPARLQLRPLGTAPPRSGCGDQRACSRGRYRHIHRAVRAPAPDVASNRRPHEGRSPHPSDIRR